ncbi:MAG: GntR family transcriptional regulator [Caulobacteraceae bacterium]|nr:GntR family transcriptional regulator [Caulobacteraceae bacterium]
MAGRFRLRQRLDASAIASDLGVSTTPVREALLRLTSERLVSFRPSHGFAVAMWSESGLRDLYRWRGELAELALASFAATAQPMVDAAASYADKAADLLAGLAIAAQPNSHTQREMPMIGCTWRGSRKPKSGRTWSRTSPISKAILSGSIAPIRSALRKYHMRRCMNAKRIRDCAALLGLSSNGA